MSGKAVTSRGQVWLQSSPTVEYRATGILDPSVLSVEVGHSVELMRVDRLEERTPEGECCAVLRLGQVVVGHGAPCLNRVT